MHDINLSAQFHSLFHEHCGGWNFQQLVLISVDPIYVDPIYVDPIYVDPIHVDPIHHHYPYSLLHLKLIERLDYIYYLLYIH